MPKKSLGQHWLKDPAILGGIADSAELTPDDTVLEVGPGLGTLTSVLLRRAKQVIAVEYDDELAAKLPGQFPGKDLQVVHGDILNFDLRSVPAGYKVVANVPYYITSKIISYFLAASNRPECMVLLVQQEVAEKYAHEAGELTANAVFLQVEYTVHLGIRVPKMYFIPPPKVDSQVLVCKKRDVSKIAQEDRQAFRRVVQAGFAAKRKKLRGSIAAGLSISKSGADELLSHAGIDPNVRAEDLSIDDWLRLAHDAV